MMNSFMAMESKYLALPEQKNYERAYELAYHIAGEQLAKVDIEQQCRNSGAQYQIIDSRAVITIEYLNQPYLVTFPGVEISLAGSAEKVSLRDKVLILHYFLSAQGTPLANRLITFRELPEGSTYFPTFLKRTGQPVADYLGKEPHLLVAVAEKLGGHKVDYGDIAVTINAFPRVPITIILWRGDAEFSPQGSVVFDVSISDYLSTEDIAVLCEVITWKLIKYLSELKTASHRSFQ